MKLYKFFLSALILIVAMSSVFFSACAKEETEDIKTNYSESDLVASFNGEYLTDGANVLFIKGQHNKIQLHNIGSGYTVKIIPNKVFNFNKNGQSSILDGETNLTNCFDFTKNADSIDFDVDLNLNPVKVLKKLYPDDNISALSRYAKSNEYFYKIVIQSGNSTLNINFGLSNVPAGNPPVENVDLDVPNIVFD